ncbi:hypothetical protein B0H34DRAFT_717360 [Crassisporium funariophilum]|nr:hypothetical protein B0H34DRAFT_717360 [Crassisporium funariophilum]
MLRWVVGRSSVTLLLCRLLGGSHKGTLGFVLDLDTCRLVAKLLVRHCLVPYDSGVHRREPLSTAITATMTAQLSSSCDGNRGELMCRVGKRLATITTTYNDVGKPRRRLPSVYDGGNSIHCPQERSYNGQNLPSSSTDRFLHRQSREVDISSWGIMLGQVQVELDFGARTSCRTVTPNSDRRKSIRRLGPIMGKCVLNRLKVCTTAAAVVWP